MKRVLLVAISFAVLGLVSCKEENKKTNTEDVKNENINSTQTENSVEGFVQQKEIILPILQSEDGNIFAEKYNDYVIELKAAADGNPEKLTELTFKAVDLEKEFQKIKENLSPEDEKKLTEFIESLKQSVQ